MSDHAQHQPVTIGVLAGWQFYWTATPLSYLSPVFQGICQAAQTLGINVQAVSGRAEELGLRANTVKNTIARFPARSRLCRCFWSFAYPF